MKYQTFPCFVLLLAIAVGCTSEKKVEAGPAQPATSANSAPAPSPAPPAVTPTPSGQPQPARTGGSLVQEALAAGAPAMMAEPNLDKFARCLTEKKAVMYGAFWCQHCKEQKEMFGRSFVYINYIECAVPGKPPNVQTPVCVQNQVKQYPTWVFADGQRLVGTKKLDDLSAASGCPLQ